MRVLIVDDVALLRALLAAHVEALGGVVVAQCGDIATAIRDATTLVPDVIFVDGRLGGVGPAAVSALCGAAPQARVFGIVAQRETSLGRTLLAAGAAGVLLRPSVRARVAATLRAIVPSDGVAPNAVVPSAAAPDVVAAEAAARDVAAAESAAPLASPYV